MSIKTVILLSKKEAKPFMGKPNVLSFNKPLNSVVNIGLEDVQMQDAENGPVVITPDHFLNDPKRNKKQKTKKKKKDGRTKRGLFTDSPDYQNKKDKQKRERDIRQNDIRMRTGIAAENRRLWNIANAERTFEFEQHSKTKSRQKQYPKQEYYGKSGSKKRKKTNKL